MQAVESAKEKIKSALPTASAFDPASLQVRPVLAWAMVRIAVASAKEAARS